MKHHLLSIICLAGCLTLQAQKDSVYTYKHDKSLLLFLALGGGYNNYKNLNTTLDDAGLPGVSKFSLIGSIELNLRLKNLLIGLSQITGKSYKRPDNYNVSLLNIKQQLHIGYYIANTKNFHLAPQVGIGRLSSAVDITQRNIDDFNNVLADKNSININQITGVLDFCLRFDFANFTLQKSSATSIRLGYQLGLSNRGWGIDAFRNSTINNSPKDRINQLYVLLALGFVRNN